MADEVILGIHSNVVRESSLPAGGDGPNVIAGHAWLSVTRDGVTTYYGLWPDEHPEVQARGLDNGAGSDVRTGMESGPGLANRYVALSPEQAAELETRLTQSDTWGYTHNCSSWASEVYADVTGERINANDQVPFLETPRRLGQSIEALERTDPSRLDAPAELSPQERSSSGGGSSSLGHNDVQLPEQDARLLDGVREGVQRVAAQNNLAWDDGLENTVYAVAAQAREQGLTDVSHFRLKDGLIHVAQSEGGVLREASIDASMAANTPVDASLRSIQAAQPRQDLAEVQALYAQQDLAHEGPSLG